MSTITRYTNSGHKFIIDGTLDVGYTVNVTVIPADGYEFVAWLNGTDNITDLGTDTEGHRIFDISITECGISFSAQFNKITYYTITAESNNLSYGTVSGGGVYKANADVTLQATVTDSNKYKFLQWNDGSTSTTINTVAISDSTYTAYFAPQKVTLTFTAKNGTIEAEKNPVALDYGTQYTVKVIPDTDNHYHFEKWDDDNIDNPRTFTAETTTTYNAICTLDQFEIIGTSSDLNMGTVSPAQQIVDYGTDVTLTATPASANYKFVEWTDGNTDNPREFTVTESGTYTAKFDVNPQYTVNVSYTASEGSVTGTGTYYGGETVKLTATPTTGYSFVKWTDSDDTDISTLNPYKFDIDKNISYKCVFKIIATENSYTLDFDNETGEIVYLDSDDNKISKDTFVNESSATDILHLTLSPNVKYDVTYTDENGNKQTITSDGRYISYNEDGTVEAIITRETENGITTYTFDSSAE